MIEAELSQLPQAVSSLQPTHVMNKSISIRIGSGSTLSDTAFDWNSAQSRETKAFVLIGTKAEYF
jgi:hypothetical protein